MTTTERDKGCGPYASSFPPKRGHKKAGNGKDQLEGGHIVVKLGRFWHKSKQMNHIKIRVERADALEIPGDVLVMKYAQEGYGLDKLVVRKTEEAGESIAAMLPKPGQYFYTKSRIRSGVENFLFLGVPPLQEFSYKEIREFGREALSVLAEVNPIAKTLIFTIHGANVGLDETESFESQLAGMTDAIYANDYPPQLEQIVIAELVQGRVTRLTNALNDLFPEGRIPVDRSLGLRSLSEASTEKLRTAGITSQDKKHIFIAMPFAEEFDDIFHYGIQGAVNNAGYLCERADLESFTGDVMDWVRKRIETADYVIADLTKANANVYLEVGYAWGCRIPTILLAQDSEDLKFDVRGQRCIVYKRIKDLEEKLSKELTNLR